MNRFTVVIIFIIATIISLGLIFHSGGKKLVANIEFDSSHVYRNEEYGYEISYPASWTYREYPDTKTGAAFRPASSPNDYMSEFISINVLEKNADMVNAPFKEYAGVAATIQIQNYQSLASIKEVTTSAGLVGYETRWNVMPLAGGSAEISDSITYFPLRSDVESTIQVYLNNEDYKDIYEKMISTMKYTD